MLAFLGGSVIALVNALITAKQVKKESQSLSGASIIHQTLSIAYLAGIYFLSRRLSFDVFWPLIGGAAGLTIPSILFALTIAKRMQGDD